MNNLKGQQEITKVDYSPLISLPKDLANLFIKNAQSKEVKAKNFLYKEDDLKKDIICIVEGFASTFQNKQSIKFLNVYGLENLENYSRPFTKNTYAIYCYSDCKFLLLPHEVLLEELNRTPQLHLDCLNVLSKNLATIENIAQHKISAPLKNQIIALLQTLYSISEASPIKTIPVYRSDLINYLNCSASNFNRIWQKLEALEIVSSLGKGFYIKKHQALFNSIEKLTL